MLETKEIYAYWYVSLLPFYQHRRVPRASGHFHSFKVVVKGLLITFYEAAAYLQKEHGCFSTSDEIVSPKNFKYQTLNCLERFLEKCQN